MPKYNHACDIAFSIESNDAQGNDITPAQYREAILTRLASLDDAELREAVGIYNTYENE